MSLDDFASDEDLKKDKELREELGRKFPPSNALRWRDHEPEPNSWSKHIECEEVENDIEGSNEDKKIVISADAPTVYIESDLWIALKENL